MPNSSLDLILQSVINKLHIMDKRILNLEQANAIQVLEKPAAGDPATGFEGQLNINKTANTIKIYADGGWRTIATW